MNVSIDDNSYGLLAFGASIASLLLWNKLYSKCEQITSQSTQDVDKEIFSKIKDLNLPVIEISALFNKNAYPDKYAAECQKLSQTLRDFGCAAIRDPRFREEENQTFLDMMESYFQLSDGKRDARPETGYQVGVTPEHVEKARDYSDVMVNFRGENSPISPLTSQPDHKWRFFWRMNPSPNSQFGDRMNNVIPEEFPEWEEVMNTWGNRMMDAQYAIAEMLEVGLNIPPNTIQDMIRNGPHLLAPTGSDLKKYGHKADVLAAFHSDLNYITIHGKSRFPGLFVWLRDGSKVAVKIPDGCLLIQAGKELQYITGGYIEAGYHEVVVTESTIEAVKRREALGKSCWRVSSTLFAHIAYDKIMQPVGPFRNEVSLKQYPPVNAGNFVMNELQAIKLFKSYDLK